VPAWGWVLIAIGVVVVVALIVWAAYRRKQTNDLRQQFGPEYDRTVDTSQDRREAEADLKARRERREHLDIRPLSPSARDSYAERWERLQAHFVDDPRDAFSKADDLITEAMRDRGYPMDDFDQRAADISVDHPGVVEHYREAHLIAVADGDGGTETEDLRRGMVHYRVLFEELIGADDRSEVG
jgi:hypothetical protein